MRTLLLLSAGVILGTSPAAVFAQTRPHEDNVWGGYAHQPTQPNVSQQEKSAGVAPPQQQQQTTNQELNNMYQNLMRETSPRR